MERRRGKERIFYFCTRHESFLIYYMLEIQKVLINAVKWPAPVHSPDISYGNTKPIVEFKFDGSFAKIQGLHKQK